MIRASVQALPSDIRTIESPVLDEAIQRTLAEIQSIGEMFAANPRLETVLECVIQSAMRVAGGDSGSVMLLSEDGRELVVAAAVGPRAALLVGTRQPAHASIAGQALTSDGHVFIRGSADGSDGPKSDHPQELGWGLAFPLRMSRRLLGVLNVNTGLSDADLPPNRLLMLSVVANQAAIMIEVARLYGDLARKERRLEMFVDKFLRIQTEQRELAALVASSAPHPAHVNGSASPVTLADRPTDSTIDRLSDREVGVLRLLVEGLTNKEIGARLILSPDTVKNHVVRILEKLGVNDRTQAAVLAIRQGWVS